MIRNFRENREVRVGNIPIPMQSSMESCNDKLFKIIVAESATGFTAEAVEDFVTGFLLPEMEADR